MAKTEQTSPPTGTGNVSGLGETFSINLSTGQGTYSYQIPLPEGIDKHTPKLVLEYAHGVGNGPWGLGWRLPLRGITRRLDFGRPDEGIAERFIDDSAEIVQVGDGSYRAMRETAFTRYTPSGSGWKIEERNGQVHYLGQNVASQVADPDHPDRVMEWLIEQTTDVSGNSILYRYRFDNGIAYLQTVDYAIYEIRFTYESRPDIRQDGRGGFLRSRTLRCSRMQLVIDPGPNERIIRTYDLVYALASGSSVSLLTEIRLTVNGSAIDGSDDVKRPTIRFQYSIFDPLKFSLRWMNSENVPPPFLAEDDVALVTLDNAPMPGILLNRGGQEYYWANLGEGSWAQPKPLLKAPLVSSFAHSGLAFVDMDGSGTADLMVANPNTLQGYYENGGRDGWARFVAFPKGRRSTPTWSDQNLRLVDVDGDGLVDALLSQKRAFMWWRNEGTKGWSSPLLVPKSADLGDIDLADPNVYLADMTGDGSPDIVRVQSGRVEYWPNLGRGRFGERIIMQRSPRLRRSMENDSILFADIDSDGCADLIHFSRQSLVIYQNQNGMQFTDPVVIESIPTPIEGTVRAINLNGRASASLVWNSNAHRQPSYVQFEFSSEEPPYLLTGVENGSGLISEIHYSSAIEDYQRDRQSGIFWNTNFPFPYLVVRRTKETDLVSGRFTEVEFLYHEAHFERHTRQFQGFRQTERIEKGDSSRYDSKFVHHFLMAQEMLPGNGPEYAALNGLLSRIETYQLDGSPLQDRPYSIESSEYGLSVLDTTADGRNRSFVFVTVHRQEDIERTADSRVEEKTYTYDMNGNVTREEHRGMGKKDGREQAIRQRTTEVAYATSNTHYILDKPALVTLRDMNGKLVSERRLYYDGTDFLGLVSGQADRGLLTREQEWILDQTDFNNHYGDMNQAELGFVSDANADGIPSVFATIQTNKYDNHGLLIATRDPLGNETKFSYDISGLFRIKLSGPLGDTLFEYDRATTQITQTTYSDGAVTRFVYDAQGRILRSALPGQELTNATTSYSYDESKVPNSRVAHFRHPGGAISLGITYFDGRGKEFQQRVEVEAGKFLVSGIKFPNPWGDIREEFEAVFSDSPSFALPETPTTASRRFFYDARGRVIRSINYNGGVSTADYKPFRIILRDANDNDDSVVNKTRGQFDTPREEEFDVFRYLVQVTDKIRIDKQVTTFYEVGTNGELLTVSDGQGVKFRYRYDQLGNRLNITIRESGERKIWYDARKKPVRTLDAAGHDLRAVWDTLGRQTRLSSNDVVLEEYLYDDTARNALGRLAEVRYLGGRQTFTYDKAGRLTERDYYYDGETNPRSLRYEYDPLGRELAKIHTDGTRIERQLTFNGWVKAIHAAIRHIDYDPRGLPSTIIYENGVQTTYIYTPGPGRIRNQTTISPQNSILEQIEFTFDKMEFMLSCNDTSPGGFGLRQFNYDPLYQLTSASSIENEIMVQRHYDYAADYNLRRFDEARCTLHYDDSLHPDRLSGLTPDGGTLFAVKYDGNGNLLNLPSKQFFYNAKNELTRFSNNNGLRADYHYDHLGFRISKTVTDTQGQVTKTLYVGDQAEIRNGTQAYFVLIGSMRVAVLTGGTVQFLHENSIGSTAFVTNSAGQRIGKVDYLSFGNPGSDSGNVDFQTFSFHPVDPESDLIYMRRRYYSPQVGRFLTPDLMAIYQAEKFLHTPQGLHLYTFVANDPLNKTDPTGMSFWSFLGSVAGVIVGVVVGVLIVAAVVATGGVAGVLLGIGLALAAGLAVTGVSYVVASNVDPNSAFGQFMRGFMIGFNAGMNGVLAGAIFGPVVGVALGVINFLATFESVSQNSVYQGILGWSSWLMPMSWGVTALGLLSYVVNLVVAGVTFQQWNAAKIDKLAVDWKTGSIVMVGGLIRNPTAFDMGNFVFINPGYVNEASPDTTYDAILRHETGHTLAIAAFGTAFGIADLFGENIIGGGAGANDYGEKIAESHANRPGRPTIPMWG